MDRRCIGGCGFAARLFGDTGSWSAYGAGGKGVILTPVFEQVTLTGSTNADLLARVPLGAPEGLWLRADTQDGGRGRMGRTWDSVTGNVFTSTLIRLRPLDPPAASLAFVAALAVVDTIMQIAPQVGVTIKWPNDILSTGGAKLCGMLLERSDDAVVIGIGLNLTSHPDSLERPVSNLAELGANPPHPQAVVEILADAFGIWVMRWRNGELASIFKAWQARAHPVGTALAVNLPSGESLQGLFCGLSADGALQLRLADSDVRAIHAADVFLI